MQTEPPKRKRRWFQFSLRTLFVVVTLFAARCGDATWIMHDRQRLIDERDEARAEVIEATTLVHLELGRLNQLERLLRSRKDAAPALP